MNNQARFQHFLSAIIAKEARKKEEKEKKKAEKPKKIQLSSF